MGTPSLGLQTQLPTAMPVNLKRAYEKPSLSDGTRVLVERLWPRGLTKDKPPRWTPG